MTKAYIINNDKYDLIKNEYLPNFIKERVSKYKQYDDYINSYVAWYYLYKILNNEFQIKLETINHNEYDKPYINNIYFNISHSKSLVCICISEYNCGVDIEFVNLNKDLKLIKKKLGLDEDISNDAVIKRWTKIEANCKCLGTGIIYSKLLEYNDDNVFTKEIYDLNNNKYYISVITDNENEYINLVELN